MLFHKLGHVETDQRVGRVKEVLRQLLDKLGLADARGADKDEAHRLVLGRNAHTVAAYRRGDGLDGLILADDVFLEALVKLAQTAKLVFTDSRGGNLRPELDYAGEVVHRELRVTLRAELVELGLRLDGKALELGQTLKVGFFCALQKLALLVVILDLAVQLHAAVDVLVVQVQIRACLVDEVDGLVGQESVGDVALGQQHRLTQNALGNFDTVELLVVVGDTLQNFERVLHVRLVDRDRLEAALERGVLFNVLAILGERRRADDLNFASGERRLQDVGGVHAALGVARADDVMHFVDDKDDVAHLADLLDEALHAALKLAAELRARDERGQVKKINLLASQLERHVARDDALGEALGNGRLADARLTDQAGVVLLAAVQNLDDAFDLLLAADDRVELAVACALGEIDAVGVEEFVLAPLFDLLVAARALRLLGLVAILCVVRGGISAEKAAQERERGGLAVLVLVIGVRIVGVGQTFEVFRAAESAHHFIGDIVKVLIRDAHAAHHLVHLRQSEIFRALEAKSFVDVLPVFLTGDEHNGDILFTSGTKLRLHSISSLG